MSNLLEITLGIMTAMGGFVDVSELVFTAQAGSRFLYALIWVIALGTFIIIVFGEMSGRVAAISKQPVFNLMRQRLGLKFGLVILAAASIVNFITCAAEIGGIGIVLHLGLGIPYRLATSLATIALIAIVWLLPFKAIERVFGLLGLFMITFIVAAVALHPPWNEVVTGLIPNIPAHLSGNLLLTYAYFIVAIISAVVFPYETYFYSAGAIEEHWSKKDLMVNRLTTIVGFILGSVLAISILVNAALLFAPRHVDPQLVGTSAMEVAIPFGKVVSPSRYSVCFSQLPGPLSKRAYAWLTAPANSSVGNGVAMPDRARRLVSLSSGSEASCLQTSSFSPVSTP